MLKKVTLASVLLAVSSQTLAFDSWNAENMSQAVQNSQQQVGQLKQKHAGCGALNPNDYYIKDVILPEVETRLEQSLSFFRDSAQSSPNPQSEILFRDGCVATARSALKLSTAYLKSLQSNCYNAFSSTFESIKEDLDQVRQENACN